MRQLLSIAADTKETVKESCPAGRKGAGQLVKSGAFLAGKGNGQLEKAAATAANWKKREAPPAAANGWVEQKPKKTNQKKDVPKDVLLPEGFSGKVVASTAGRSAQEPTVCLASMSEARAALAELKSSKPMAVLAPANIDSKGKEVSVLVEDASGKKQSRVRFLFQLGTGEITYSSSLPRGQEVRGNCKKVVLQLSQEHTVKEAWEASLKAPEQAAKRWLLHRA